MNKISIDGSIGEGGGQIFRTSLTLSLLTKKTLQIHNIRSKRSSPGLKQQHLTALKAASEISRAQVEGDVLGSQEVLFIPGKVNSGKYSFVIPTAGSASLALQTILLPLTVPLKESQISITGGTHVPWSPPFHYLSWLWLPWLEKIGYLAKIELHHCGYYPAGGGRMTGRVFPAETIHPIKAVERGKLIQIRGLSAVSNLSLEIAKRQRLRFISRIGSLYPLNDIRAVDLPGKGKGTFLAVLAEFERTTACFCSLGEKGKRAEEVADEVAGQIKEFIKSPGCIDRYLADQLLVPLSFASDSSKLITSEITSHLLTNAEVIQQFLPVIIDINGELGEPGEVIIIPR